MAKGRTVAKHDPAENVRRFVSLLLDSFEVSHQESALRKNVSALLQERGVDCSDVAVLYCSDDFFCRLIDPDYPGGEPLFNETIEFPESRCGVRIVVIPSIERGRILLKEGGYR